MGISASKDSEKLAKSKVVIIGGSYAGRGAVHLLDPSFDVTWIERRPCLIHKMMVRSIVREEWIEPTLIASDKIIRRGKLVQGNVTSVDAAAKEVVYETVAGVAKVSYDFLVVASGATSKSPVEPIFAGIKESTLESITSFFKRVASTVAKHKNILIVGGGPVGCEIAGEIKSKHPSSNVIVANKSGSLCSGMRMDKAASDKIKKSLEKHGIQAILNCSVPLSDTELKQGLIEYDSARDFTEHIKNITLVINCTGSTPNTEFLPADILTEEKLVKVNEFLQASDSIFAIGDCNNVSEPKLYVTCGTKKVMFGLPVGQADIVAKNLVSLVAGKPLTAYKPKSNTAKPHMLLPIGPTDAVSINAPGFFGKMKAKDYFYPGQWKFSGLQPPRKPLAS